MKTHYGQIVEYTIRKKRHSITDFARLVNANRRSVYNWFKQEDLKTEIIYRIGLAIKHNFSKEFPELFEREDFDQIITPKFVKDPVYKASGSEADCSWKERYINLLESYNKYVSSIPPYKVPVKPDVPNV